MLDLKKISPVFTVERLVIIGTLVSWEKGAWKETHRILNKYGLEKMS